MKFNQLVAFLFLFNSYSVLSQEKLININWVENKTYLSEVNKFNVPYFDNYKHNFEPNSGVILITQWNEKHLIDPNSVKIDKINYETVDVNTLGNLNVNSIPNELNFKLSNSLSIDGRSVYLELKPFFNDNGIIKKITSASISYKKKTNQSLEKVSTSTSSVLSQGSWYRFEITNSGVYKLNKNFLNNLGVNTSNIDPRTIKIYGSGGEMIPLLNSSEFPFDPVQNAIKVVGEEDGIFNNEDYIIFFAKGQDTFNEESNTNLNSFTDKTYYLLNVSAGFGKRVVELVEPSGDENFMNLLNILCIPTIVITIIIQLTSDNIKYLSNKNFEFNFDNLITTKPIHLKVYTAAVSEIPTSMSLKVNNLEIDNFYYQSINDPILATEDYFDNEVLVFEFVN